MNRNFPINSRPGDINQRAAYKVTAARQKTSLTQPLYDSVLGQGGETEFTFFQAPIGQNGKTENDTNMRAAGQLPSPQSFLCEGISLSYFFRPESAIGINAGTAAFIEAVESITRGGNVVFSISTADYYQIAPIGAIVSHQSYDGFMETDGGVSPSQSGYIQPRGKMTMIEPVMIESTQNFAVKLRGINPDRISGSDIQIFCYLWGTWIRASQ